MMMYSSAWVVSSPSELRAVRKAQLVEHRVCMKSKHALQLFDTAVTASEVRGSAGHSVVPSARKAAKDWNLFTSSNQ